MAGIVVDEAQGSAVTDVDGNTLPRLHRRHQRQRARALRTRRSSKAVQEQVAKASVGSFTSRARVELGERLAAHAAGARRAPAAALLGRRRGGRERAAPRQVPHRQVRVGQLLGRLPRQDDGRAVADGLDLQGQARADGAAASHLIPYADCYRCPVGLELPELRHRLRRGRPQAGQDRQRRRDRRGHRRADAGHGRQRHPAQGVPARGARRSPTSSARC